MKLIEADKVEQAIKDYWKAQVDRLPIPKSIEEHDAYANRLGTILEYNSELLKAIDELPPTEPDTTTHGPIPVKKGGNDEDRTTDDYISRTQAIDAIRDYLVEKRCPDDGTLACRLIENEVINKLPSVQPDDDRLERCRFEYVNACKMLAHRTPDTRKKDINDAYAVVRALNPIFGEEGF